MEHEVYVPFPVGTVRQALTEPERVARCVPGAQLDADADPRAPEGRLRLRISGSTITYRGSLRVAARDGEADAFDVGLRGTEARGDGSAELDLTVRLAPGPSGEGTALSCTAAVRTEGRLAEAPGDSAGTAGRRLLDRFAEALAADLTAHPVDEAATGAPAEAGADAVHPGVDPDAGAVPSGAATLDASGAGDATGAGDAVAGGAAARDDAAGADAISVDDAIDEAGDVDDAAEDTDATADTEDLTDDGAAGTEDLTDDGAVDGVDGADDVLDLDEVGDVDDAGDVRDELGDDAEDVGDDGAAGDLDDIDEVGDVVEVSPHAGIFEADIPPSSLDPLAEAELGAVAKPPAEAAHARRTMIGRSAEEVDHAPPRGRYAPVPAPETSSTSAVLRWAAPAAAVVLASAVVVGRALRRRR